MKRVIAFFLFSIPMMVSAQKTHTVAAKESFYSIGRMYNVHPKELATYNNISFETGLSIGQVIKIPAAGNTAPMPDVPKPAVTETIKTAPVKTAKTTGSSPIYHTVAPKEGLYSISKKYNASIADIKKWNNMTSDALTIGMNLVVGHGAGNGKTETAEPPVTVKTVPEVKQQVVTKSIETKKQDDVYVAPKVSAANNGPVEHNGGYFKTFYNQQIKEKGGSGIQDKGQAGIFKSTSGWDDGKYYCLHNSAPAGSFIKITNPANNKAVYAKVLDLIPDLKQNSGIIIRISNAAASELGVNGTGFDCMLNY